LPSPFRKSTGSLADSIGAYGSTLALSLLRLLRDIPSRYYSGEKVAPVLTLVIGGNHEASNYMWEL
jgi:hypothetical protein